MIRLLHVGITAGEGKWLSKELRRRTQYAELRLHEGPDRIRSVFASHRPDVVFMQIQQDIPSLFPVVQMMSKKSLVINWSGDVRSPVPDWFFRWKPYCVTCFSNMNDVREIGGEYLQIGIDPEIYRPWPRVQQMSDIVFMANMSTCFPLSNYRVEIVNFLRSTYRADFQVIGGWPGAKMNLNNDQYAEARYYSGAKIAISISHFDYSRYFSDRLIRAMGAGCFTLSHHYTDIEMDFEPGKHLDTFRNKEELKEKIDFYLANPELRKRIAIDGHHHVHNKFTTRNMVDDILNIYRKYAKIQSIH